MPKWVYMGLFDWIVRDWVQCKPIFKFLIPAISAWKFMFHVALTTKEDWSYYIEKGNW